MTPSLTPVAKHVYNGAPLDYVHQPTPSQSASGASTPSVPVKQVNGVAHAQNFRLEVPKVPPSASPQNARPVVQIQQPDNFRRKDYAAAPSSPRRGKLENDSNDTDLALRQRTQRQLGDQAVQKFQNSLLHILEVYQRLETDEKEQSAQRSEGLFEVAGEDDDYDFRLTLPALDKLQINLKQLVDLKRLGDISKEHISQLRQLCEEPLHSIKTLNLRLSNEPSDDDISTWQDRLRSAEIGASSGSVILLTAVAGVGPDLDPETYQTVARILDNVFESCLIPVIEARPAGSTEGLFKTAAANAIELRKLLDTYRKLLDQFSSACIQLRGVQESINTVEFLAAKLIFVQNGPTDKVSALGSKTYERIRKQVMSSLARIFAAFPDRRSSIINEILLSVDKLPSTSRSGRQFTLGDGKSIMLVTALFVQLVQTSTLDTKAASPAKGRRIGNLMTDHSDDEGKDDNMKDEADDVEDGLSSLKLKSERLYTLAYHNSIEIINYLAGKASGTAKTADLPYRNILDLFLEDLLALLPLPEWPAAQLMLEVFYVCMKDYSQSEKAGVKNMALESLGTMGAAIAASKSAAQTHATSLAREADTGSDATQTLIRLTEEHFTRGLIKEDLFGLNGPFALTCRYFNMQNGEKSSKSLRARAAHSFYVAQYAVYFCRNHASNDEDDIDRHASDEISTLARELDEAMSEAPPALHTQALLPREAILAYMLSNLTLPFCRRYEGIAQILLASLSSDQAQVRSRSIKSVVTMLETDASLLDSQDLKIERYIFPCASDDSALVRDAALSLIAKFLISKPAYEERGIRKLIDCTQDDKVGVQKRAINHLADIYVQESRANLKAWIAETLLRRIADVEDSVSELAKKTLAEAWLVDNVSLAKEPQDSAKAAVAIESLTDHIVATIQRDLEELSPLLTRFLITQMKSGKVKDLNILLVRVVQVLFNLVIANKANEASLQLLVCLAEAYPKAVIPTQLEHLQQYLKNFNTGHELVMFNAVIGIFRHVLPQLSIAHETMLINIRQDLFLATTKLAVRSDLDGVMACQRIIEDVIPSSGRWVKLLKSSLSKISPETAPPVLKRLIFILGSIAKHINVEKLQLKDEIAAYTGGSVSGFLIRTMLPYITTGATEEVRLTALDSVGCVCQAWPAHFNDKGVMPCFLAALGQPAGSSARNYALRTFEELFAGLGDSSTSDTAQDKDAPEPVQDLKKMGGSEKVQNNLSAISALAETILTPIARIALSTQDNDLHIATRTIANMSKHGMFHPKDYAGVMVALQTSEDAEVRAIVDQAHAKAHTLHESVWEREYTGAVKAAFRYQLRMAQDPAGARQGKAKLGACFSTISTSGSKYVKKFASNIISRMNTDISKLDLSRPVPEHVLFVRFVAQNLGSFEYAKMEELLHVILQLEILFSKNGGEIADAIDRHKLLEGQAQGDATQLEMNGETSGEDPTPKAPITAPQIDPIILKRLAAAACAVTIVSETRSHLKRQYGITRDIKKTMDQAKLAKESTKVPVRVHGINGDRFWNSTANILSSLDDSETMLKRCRDFHQLMNVDEDIVVGEDGEEVQERYDADGQLVPPPPRGKKRKSGAGSTGGTPRKRGRPHKNATPSRRSSSASSRDDPDADYY